MSDPDYRRAEQGSTSDNWYLGLEIEQQREHEALAEDNTTCLTMVVNDKELLKTVGIAPTLADQRLFNRGRHAEDKDANKYDEFCHSIKNIACKQFGESLIKTSPLLDYIQSSVLFDVLFSSICIQPISLKLQC